jgi:hypothetical protein
MNSKITIEEVLQSLEKIQRAEPSPFLYTRIKGRMIQNEKGLFNKILQVVISPKFVLALTCIMIVINGYFLSNKVMGQTASIEKTQPIAVEYVHQSLNPYETINDSPQ